MAKTAATAAAAVPFQVAVVFQVAAAVSFQVTGAVVSSQAAAFLPVFQVAAVLQDA